MVTGSPSNPDVFQAAAMMAARDGTNVDIAIVRLRRAARAAGLSEEQLASQIVGGPTSDRRADAETSSGQTG